MSASLTANSFDAELRIDAHGSEADLESFIGHQFWHGFVPGVTLEAGSVQTDPDLTITFDPELEWQFDPAVNEITCPPKNILHAICTAGYMLDAKRQALGLYTVHGNVIANDTTAVALVGPVSGIGKTTLSSRAAQRGWQWMSDEKFVMNDQGLLVGSVAGTLDDNKTRHSAGEHIPGDIEPYTYKIGTFVIPITTDRQELVSHTYDHEKAFWHLHDEMSRDVRMAPLDLNGPEVPLPSFDYNDIAVRRRTAARTLSAHIPFLSVAGNPDAILDYLSEPIQ